MNTFYEAEMWQKRISLRKKGVEKDKKLFDGDPIKNKNTECKLCPVFFFLFCYVRKNFLVSGNLPSKRV